MGDKPGVSFGFSKKVESKRLTKSAVSENTNDRKAELDFVLSLESNVVKSTAPKPKENEPFVIPLIKKNRWREGAEKRLADVKKDYDPDNLDQQAAKELLEETARYNETWEEGDKPDTSFAIPLLMQNKVPEGFETDDKLDVALRPDVPDDADYEQIPIEHFGMAMLRGMGWKEGQGIGKTGKVIVPIEAQLRPKGLGLGADRSQAANEKDKKSNNARTETGEEDLVMKKGAFCVVLNGKNKDLYGVVEGVYEDNARLVIKLALSGQSITLTQYNVKLVGKKEYDKYSKYLNKGKSDRYKEDEQKQNGHESGNDKWNKDRDDDSSDRDRSERSRKRDKPKGRYEVDTDSHKRKHRLEDGDHNSSDSRSKKQKSDPESSSSSSSKLKRMDIDVKLWLRKDLRVRVVDKHYKKGHYYKEKVVVVDVISLNNTVCRTDDGKVIDGLTHDQVETVIPKQDDAYVVLCSGKHRGQLGKIVKKNKDRCQALVQLLSEREIILEVSFDDICEYVGRIDDEFDYY